MNPTPTPPTPHSWLRRAGFRILQARRRDAAKLLARARLACLLFAAALEESKVPARLSLTISRPARLLCSALEKARARIDPRGPDELARAWERRVAFPAPSWTAREERSGRSAFSPDLDSQAWCALSARAFDWTDPKSRPDVEALLAALAKRALALGGWRVDVGAAVAILEGARAAGGLAAENLARDALHEVDCIWHVRRYEEQTAIASPGSAMASFQMSAERERSLQAAHLLVREIEPHAAPACAPSKARPRL